MSIRAELELAGPRAAAGSATAKKDFTERLSLKFANALRPAFDGITPDAGVPAAHAFGPGA